MVDIREEELKNKVGEEYFSKYDTTQILGNIDFAVALKEEKGVGKLPFTDIPQYLYWAEAKRGAVEDIFLPVIQLVLTIGKARSMEKHIPPKYLGAFDAEKILFIPYEKFLDVFHLNDFNWNVTPSDYSTKEFQLLENLLSTLKSSKELLLFSYTSQKKELQAFIKDNFHLNNEETKKIRVSRNNFIHIYQKWREAVMPSIDIDWEKTKKRGIIAADFFLADLMSENDETIIENLYVILEQKQYILDRKTDSDGLFNSKTVRFKDEQKSYHTFWNIYDRPPKDKEDISFMIERRDLLVPQDVREVKGSFFTPRKWVQLSQEDLASYLGNKWQEEYYIWDCCAGTGNLLAGLTNAYHVYASTLDQADVEVMKERIRSMNNETDHTKRRGKSSYSGANLLESHIFQFDFLNDPFSKLPESLQAIINDPQKRRKLVIYINPPYKEAGNARQRTGTGKNQAGVTNISLTYEKYKDEVGKSFNELFAQFFIRIYKEIPSCFLAEFSTLKILQGSNFELFRSIFKAELKKLFIVPANTFDNVKGQFPIGFFIWDTSVTTAFKGIEADVYDSEGNFKGTKSVYAYDGLQRITAWMSSFNTSTTSHIGMLNSGRTDFQNQSLVRIENMMTAERTHAALLNVTHNNLIIASIFLAVRHTLEKTWINHNEQFLYPNDGWQGDTEFQIDCLAYTLFHQKNRISSNRGENHWIPFKEEEVGAKDTFGSHFMSDFIAGKLSLEEDAKENHSRLFSEETEEKPSFPIGTTPITFSPEAQLVFESGRKLWQYYHAQPNSNPNASYYDIREYFQGRDEKGKMNSTSEDTTYNTLEKNLRSAVKDLGEHKIKEKIYQYGFLLRQGEEEKS